ncbi:MAG: murein biosynthesis integral membrane protein MurJ [Gemmatimonadetes bacterium]|nr:murein biosynthesis integral membrane protein MurJ [Gemmatimonadota bacterium]
MVRGARRINLYLASFVGAAGTLFSRVLGAARDVVIGHLFGAGAAADAFWMAFTVPSVFRRFVADEGLTGALIPAVSRAERDEGVESARRLAGATLVALFVAGVVLCGAGALAAPWLVRLFAPGFVADPEKLELTITLTRWLFPFILFVSLVSFCEGLLNRRGHFFVPKIAPGLVSGSIAASAWFLYDRFEEPVFALVPGVLIGGAAHLVVCLPPLLRIWGPLRLNLAGLRSQWFAQLAGEMGKVVAIGAFAQVNIIVLRSLASLLPPGSVTQYWYATRMVDLAQGAVAVGVSSAALPLLAENVAGKDWIAFRATFSRSVRLIALVLFPVAALLVVLGLPAVRLLFEHGEFTPADSVAAARTLTGLLPFMLAVAGINIVKKAFFALDDRWTLIWVGGLGVLLTALFGGGLAIGFGLEIRGLALGLSISSLMQLATYLFVLERRTEGACELAALVSPLTRTAAAAMPAGVTAWVLLTWVPLPPGRLFDAAGLCLAGGIGVAVFAGVARLLGVEEVKAVWGRG